MAERRAIHRIALAAIRKPATEGHLVDRIVRRNRDAALVPSTVTAAQGEPVLDPQVVERRIYPDSDRIALMVRFEPVTHNLQVQQQCVRHYVVGTERLAVEFCGIGIVDLEITVIDKEITVNRVNARLTHKTQHLPHAFRYQERITVALDQQVARQVPGIKFTERMNFSRPPVRRAESVQRHQGSEQLHRRRRVAGHTIVPTQHGFTAVSIPYMDAQGIMRNLANVEDALNRRRQLILRCHRNRHQRNKQQQAAEHPGFHVTPDLCICLSAKCTRGCPVHNPDNRSNRDYGDRRNPVGTRLGPHLASQNLAEVVREGAKIYV